MTMRRTTKLPIQIIGLPNQRSLYGIPLEAWEPPKRRQRSGWKWACPCGKKHRTQKENSAHMDTCPTVTGVGAKPSKWRTKGDYGCSCGMKFRTRLELGDHFNICPTKKDFRP